MLTWLWLVVAVAVALLAGWGVRALVIHRRHRRLDATYRELLRGQIRIRTQGIVRRDVQ